MRNARAIMQCMPMIISPRLYRALTHSPRFARLLLTANNRRVCFCFIWSSVRPRGIRSGCISCTIYACFAVTPHEHYLSCEVHRVMQEDCNIKNIALFGDQKVFGRCRLCLRIILGAKTTNYHCHSDEDDNYCAIYYSNFACKGRNMTSGTVYYGIP